MSPEAVRARTEMYGSPGSGGVADSRAILMSPETESRSSQAGRLSAMPTVTEPEAERRSTEPLAEVIPMSPDPEFAWRLPPRRDCTTISPEPDLAVSGQLTSPTETSPDPEPSRAPLPATRATEMFPDPVLQSRSAALPMVTSPEPLTILERPTSALTEMSADPVLITYCSPCGTPRRKWAFVYRRNCCGKLIRSQRCSRR